MKRRGFVSTLLLATTSGCLSGDSATPTQESPTDTEQSPTTRSTTSTTLTTATTKQTETPTQTRALTPKYILPPSGAGWTLEQTSEEDWRYLGGEDGIRGYYTGPDGVDFQVVVMRTLSSNDPKQIGENWKCVGKWSVVLTLRDFVIAASSGTKQTPRTPDFAPWMDGTPHPNTTTDARELLERSPALTTESIDAGEVSCSS